MAGEVLFIILCSLSDWPIPVYTLLTPPPPPLLILYTRWVSSTWREQNEVSILSKKIIHLLLTIFWYYQQNRFIGCLILVYWHLSCTSCTMQLTYRCRICTLFLFTVAVHPRVRWGGVRRKGKRGMGDIKIFMESLLFVVIKIIWNWKFKVKMFNESPCVFYFNKYNFSFFLYIFSTRNRLLVQPVQSLKQLWWTGWERWSNYRNLS